MNPLALVVENDAGTRKLLAVLLQRIGFVVDVAATGADALLLLEHVHYDVLFVDLMLPGVSGRDIVGWLARERPDSLRRVVALSSESPAEIHRIRDQWPELRAFRKPFELGEIIESAHSAIADGPQRGEMTAAEQFVRHSVCAGAKAGVVVRVQGSTIDAVLDFGYAPGVVESFLPMPVDSAVPICAAIRQARPVWLASLKMATLEYPLLAPVFEKNQSRALAVVPFLRDEQVVGAAGWSFREPRLFTEAERQRFSTIAASVAELVPEKQSLTPLSCAEAYTPREWRRMTGGRSSSSTTWRGSLRSISSCVRCCSASPTRCCAGSTASSSPWSPSIRCGTSSSAKR